jgi:hypothetical protein
MAGTPRHNLPVKGRKLFLVAASAAVGLWLIVRGPLPLVSSWWVAGESNYADPWKRRHRMADWMVLSRGLLGMTREEVTSLLGGTPATGIFTEWDLVYRLGAERGFFSIDSEWLVLKFDRSGHAIDATILRD